jgi:hypothetical protein
MRDSPSKLPQNTFSGGFVGHELTITKQTKGVAIAYALSNYMQFMR